MVAARLDRSRVDCEEPQHRVTVPGFLLARTEVTQRVWRGLVGSTGLNPGPSHFVHAGDRAPVEVVTWTGVTAWCSGNGLRLPSEAEWEYGCRAGTATALPNGGLTIQGIFNSPELDLIAWYEGNSGVSYEGGYDRSGWLGQPRSGSGSGTHPVGQKDANAFGLYDVIGNVWELCQDDWHENYEEAPADGSVWGTHPRSDRVRRGGSWFSPSEGCRSASRIRASSDLGGSHIGFRPARSLP